MNKLNNKDGGMLHRNVYVCDLMVQNFLKNLNNNSNNNKSFPHFFYQIIILVFKKST